MTEQKEIRSKNAAKMPGPPDDRSCSKHWVRRRLGWRASQERATSQGSFYYYTFRQDGFGQGAIAMIMSPTIWRASIRCVLRAGSAMTSYGLLVSMAGAMRTPKDPPTSALWSNWCRGRRICQMTLRRILNWTAWQELVDPYWDLLLPERKTASVSARSVMPAVDRARLLYAKFLGAAIR